MDAKQTFDFSDPDIVFEFGIGNKDDNVAAEMFIDEYGDAFVALGVDGDQKANTLVVVKMSYTLDKGAPDVDHSYEGCRQEAKPYAQEADPLSAYDILDGRLIPFPYTLIHPQVYLDDGSLVIVFQRGDEVAFTERYGRVVTGYTKFGDYEPDIAFIAINDLDKAEYDALAQRLG